MIFEKVAFGG